MLPADTLIQNRYRIIEQIGRGGMGAVYKATDTRLRSTVALKQMLVEGERLRKAFEREAQLLAGLRHPALPRVSDHFADQYGQFLVMEFVLGEDFESLLVKHNHQPFLAADVLHWADQVLSALDYLHTHEPPIIHRDIKPQNLKLTPRGEVMLLDFGLAKGSSIEMQATMARSVPGYTRQYASLEQIRLIGTDARSDLYSLAATLYHLLSGRPPVDAMSRVLGDPAEGDPLLPLGALNPQLLPTVADVLMQALAIQARDRPQTAAEMRAALRDAQQGLVRAPPTVQRRTLVTAVVAQEPPDATLLHTQAMPQPPSNVVAVSPSLLALPARRKLVWAAGVLLLLALLAGALAWALTPRAQGISVASATTGVQPPATIQGALVAAPTVSAAPTAPVAAPTAPAATAAPTSTTAPTADSGATAAAQTALAATTVSLAAQATQTALEQAARAFAATAPTVQATLPDARAAYAPDVDTRLIEQVYAKNIVRIRGLRALKANQTDNANVALWARDLDYAVSGYSGALGNMNVLRESIELLLKGVDKNGIAPEALFADKRGYIAGGSWDSMPNLVHAAYVYVAKTGDRAFYAQHRDELQRIGAWIASLDQNGDGVPDKDAFPFGYYNSVKNSVRHTYALARFYGAFNDLAELEKVSGNDPSPWQARAASLRTGFHRPVSAGGYWLDDQAWPIAWFAADGTPVKTLETFGVFEALRSGLIAPADGAHYTGLVDALHTSLPQLLDGPAPMRLTLGGYDESVQRTDVVPRVPKWMLDASTPWVVGVAAPVYAAAGYPQDAARLMDAYKAMALNTNPPILQFAAGDGARYGAGDSKERGVTLGSAAWFIALYEGHYGLHPTLDTLIVQPRPFATLPADAVTDYSYQGARVQFALDARAQTYTITADQPLRVTLRPLGNAKQMRVNDSPPADAQTLLLEPNKAYTVVSN